MQCGWCWRLRKVELASLDDVPSRVDSVKRSLEIIYGVRLGVDFEDVPLDGLFPTEDFLENDKHKLRVLLLFQNLKS